MPDTTHDKLRIRVNIEITAAALQAIVAYAKQSAQRTDSEAFHVDTADQVSGMVTRFLEEKDFEGFVKTFVDA